MRPAGAEERPPGAAWVESDQGPACVIDEAPLLIEVGDQHVLTMRTPGDDLALARGFLCAEGIVAPAAIASLREFPRGEESPTDRVEVRLAEGVALGPVARERLTRAHAVRPSCGLCGLVSAEGLSAGLPELGAGPQTTLATLHACEARMRQGQVLFQATGGCHAAGVFDAASGEPWAIREDVGRHNALDKALGACLAEGRDLSQATVILSGRAGYELVLKTLRLGVPVLASVSAPTRLAVELALEQDQTLVGFLRGQSGRIYAGAERLG